MSSAASTFESKEPLLSDLLREIQQGKVQLPDFQRPWRWDDVHIRSLIASVSLAYPVGAVMLLEAGGEDVRFKPRVVHGANLRDPVTPDRLILDGQQRLTSLYGALLSNQPVDTADDKGKAIKRWYYLDIARCLDPVADRMDAVLSLPEDRMERSDFGRQVDRDASTREREFELGLVPAPVLLDPVRFMEWQQGFQRHFGYGNVEKTALINAFASDVWMRFQKFKVPVIQLKKETPKEAVCQVFEKVNTGGVALTVFELMTATYAADDFHLVEDWNAPQARLHAHDVRGKVGGTEFLQAVTLLAAWRRQKSGGAAMSVKRKDVLKLRLDDYRACAPAVEAGFLRTARLLMGMRVLDERNLPYGTQLIPLAATCGAHAGRPPGHRAWTGVAARTGSLPSPRDRARAPWRPRHGGADLRGTAARRAEARGVTRAHASGDAQVESLRKGPDHAATLRRDRAIRKALREGTAGWRVVELVARRLGDSSGVVAEVLGE